MTVLSDRVDQLEATNANLVSTLQGLQTTLQQAVDAGRGPDGWSPVFALVSDDERRVLQVTDWVNGGTGTTKPATGVYVGPSGFVTSISLAIDVRGQAGPLSRAGVPVGGEILWPTADTLPHGLFKDTTLRLFSGADERSVLRRVLDPMTQFAAGALGAWYAPGFYTCFSDVNATSLSGIGGKVALMLDLSGNNLHVKNAVEAEQPILRRAATGEYYLEFDDVDDVLISDAAAGFGAPFLAVAGIQANGLAGATSSVNYFGPGSGTSLAILGARLSGGSVGSNATFVRASGGTLTSASTSNNALSDLNPHVVTGGFQSGLVFVETETETRTSTARIIEDTFSAPFQIGQAGNESINFYGGLYIVQDGIPAETVSALKEYIANNTPGVML